MGLLDAGHNDLNDSVADVALLNTDHDASTSDMLPQKREYITENQVHSPSLGHTLSADYDEDSMNQHSALPT
ncbi:hypothetical protein RJ641_005523 [Dillenia turbinata]|uniref:Uncharacterized protein n=1 Tax=Dillenia turbinata TaxID=194707 RepID=A0AAN8V6J2_9MAGN